MLSRSCMNVRSDITFLDLMLLIAAWSWCSKLWSSFKLNESRSSPIKFLHIILPKNKIPAHFHFCNFLLYKHCAFFLFLATCVILRAGITLKFPYRKWILWGFHSKKKRILWGSKDTNSKFPDYHILIKDFEDDEILSQEVLVIISCEK